MNTIDYRIAKIRCSVTVCLADGRELAGDIFLNPISRYRPEPQDPLEFLNDVEPYFALALDGNGTMLVAKRNIAYLQAPVTDEWAGRDGGVEVALAILPGVTRFGKLFPVTRSGRSRLLDYLNSTPEHFLPLVETDLLTIVNCASIAHATEVR